MGHYWLHSRVLKLVSLLKFFGNVCLTALATKPCGSTHVFHGMLFATCNKYTDFSNLSRIEAPVHAPERLLYHYFCHLSDRIRLFLVCIVGLKKAPAVGFTVFWLARTYSSVMGENRLMHLVLLIEFAMPSAAFVIVSLNQLRLPATAGFMARLYLW